MLINTKGETIGHIQVTEMASGGVGIGLVATGLTPGVHSFHIHDKGVCDRAVTFETAGGHFNPTGKAHGWNNAAGPHAGDLPNILADGRGKATAGVLTHDVTLRPGVANSLFDADGSSFVIHSGPDDYISQPAGNAGSRVACGVLVHHVALKPQPKP
ncbi:copper/Zinc superoxide dismutase [Rhodospirillum rubrum F11]|uniref:Copper/Zinc superoxide dismutase n=2 Tax=Rhodospirillum rubrum TaxID=1085 RepID=Q2RTG3_RHORT|nr:Copper/Zinc superoxide dismutase [Rhodospirillum rubrum ATCC 11170]AEO48300.1 copper/Zinc superoxide dismutase [Rhodospirillum rubrum F11]MBK5954171.1 superoxide dismutase family protein [Rhodospirillum rubrum]QXG82386.1 superoxide dismutase family protein [Rhodospirillum rubrum]HAP99410.1 superoxide dismutase family protein [Rhodospirillum rubrum]